jgi:hypothetical protein
MFSRPETATPSPAFFRSRAPRAACFLPPEAYNERQPKKPSLKTHHARDSIRQILT